MTEKANKFEGEGEGEGVKQVVLRTMQARCLASERPDAPLLMMVSGGSDSTAMCLLAHELVCDGVLSASNITVLHVNHGLRGSDSDGDERFVAHLAELCGFAYEVRRIDVDSRLQEFDGNVENAARNMRYEVAQQLEDELCEGAGVEPERGRIWVAHTQDDQVETFFMRAIVGTGPGGLAGIRYRNGRVVRPLLQANRRQLQAYIKQRVLQLGWQLDSPQDAQVEGGFWREDATNADTAAFRAFVRHKLVPLAQQYNPNLQQTLCRTVDLIADEDDYMQAQVDELAEQMLEHDDSKSDVVTLDFSQVAALPVPLRRRLIYRACKLALPANERIEQKHVDAIAQSGAQAGFAIDLPGAVRVRNQYGKLVFEPIGAGARSSSQGFEPARLQVPGQVVIDGRIRISASYVDVLAGSNAAAVDAADAGAIDVAGAVDADATAAADAADVGSVTDAVEYAKANASATCAFVDANKLKEALASSPTDAQEALLVSPWQQADTVCPLGMGGAHKKLSDIFVDRKVPRQQRHSIPVLRAGQAIVWVPGVVTDERFAASSNSRLVQLNVENL